MVWAFGDGADGGPGAQALAEMVAAASPDRVLYLGDVYEDGTEEEFKTNFGDVYGGLRLTERMEPTPGNHEWPNHRTGYDPFWQGVKGRAIPRWYAFEIGGWEILSLNSEAEHGPDSPQVRWLRERLEASDTTCRLAFWHRPRFSSGLNHGDQPDVAPLWDALRGRAALVVTGHEHNLQRHAARDGLVAIVSGAGGKDHYENADDYPGLEFAEDERDGALRLALTPGRADLSFVATDKTVLDRSRVSCRP